jgi:hypothetical protein
MVYHAQGILDFHFLGRQFPNLYAVLATKMRTAQKCVKYDFGWDKILFNGFGSVVDAVNNNMKLYTLLMFFT